MKVVKPKLTLAPGPLSRMGKDLIEMPGTYSRAFAKNAAQPIAKFNTIVQKVPAKLPGHPFIWSKIKAAQNRASRWWFAAIAGKIPGVRIETQGGRYKRKNDVTNAGATIDPDNGEITIEAPGGNAGLYTFGPKQIPSHKDTGWPRIDNEAKILAEELEDVAINTWFDIGTRAGDK